MENKTISAVSTPLGEGGIGIVRLSGDKSFSIVKNLFIAKGDKLDNKLSSHKLIYGHIQDPENNKIIDEVLVSFMKAPYTYTREDVVEINCHGGIVPLKKILDLTLKYGAEIAQPGEFTQRAFLNGRIDLSQAEAVIDLIRARTDKGREVAVNQLEGKLTGKVNEIKNELIRLISLVEVNIDFPDEDLEEINMANIKEDIMQIIEKINYILNTADKGKIYREGLKMVIIGKPNVGKSSLLNALLREQRAIVTEVPGTTRDVLEEIINIKGVPLKIIDTAGIRKAEDPVEKIGVEKAEKKIKESDLIILMLDAQTGLEDEDRVILNNVKDKKIIVLLNKIDLVSKEEAETIGEKIQGLPLLMTSLKYGKGLKELEEMILDLVFKGEIISTESILVTNSRHKSSLEKAKKNLEEALRAVEDFIPLDLVAVDLKSGWESLGEITGETIDEAVLDKIFSEYCVGK